MRQPRALGWNRVAVEDADACGPEVGGIRQPRAPGRNRVAVKELPFDSGFLVPQVFWEGGYGAPSIFVSQRAKKGQAFFPCYTDPVGSVPPKD
jgi:hypothetical protein